MTTKTEMDPDREQRLKILVTADVLRGTKTGVEHYTQNLIEALTRRSDVALTVLLARPEQAQLLRTPVRHVTLRGPHRRWPIGMMVRPPRELAGYDLIHCPTVRVPFLPPRRGHPRERPVYTVTVHDLVPLAAPGFHKAHYRAYYRHVLPHLLRRFDGVVAISNATARDLNQHMPNAHRLIRVIYSGTRWEPVSRDQIKPKDDYVLAVGTLEPRKNLQRLIDAFTAVKQAHRDLPHRLLIAGKPGWGPSAQTTAAQRDRRDVEWLGYVDDDRLRTLYEHARVLVYPSLYEGFGLPVIEAMALGCPVITSDRTSLPEAGGDAAIYVNPESTGEIRHAIERVLFNESLARDLADRGLDHARPFTWDRCAEQFVTFARDLIRARHDLRD